MIKVKRGIGAAELEKALKSPAKLNEKSPWAAHRDYETMVSDATSKQLLALFLAIRDKWLRLPGPFKKAAGDNLFKLNGKVFISPKTGKPLTKKQWEAVLGSLDKAMIRIFKDTPEMLVKKALVLGKILQGMDFEQRERERLGSLVRWPTLPDDLNWRNAMSFGEANAAELIVDLRSGARKAIANTINEAIQNRKTTKQLETDLFDDFADLNRDWRRIAETEIADNVNNGILLSELEEVDEGETRYMIGMSGPGACEHCERLIAGQVVVLVGEPVAGGFVTIKGERFPAIWPGKNNVGRKARNYWATAPLHPHCRCSWTRYYPEMANLIGGIKKSLALHGHVYPKLQKARKPAKPLPTPLGRRILNFIGLGRRK
jgi:hypothetical protein